MYENIYTWESSVGGFELRKANTVSSWNYW